jgi:hypothetical protein
VQKLDVGAARAAVVAADFNLDGLLDLASTDGGDIAVLLGIGGGLFQEAKKFTAGVNFESLVVADWNEDGLSDLRRQTTSPIS